VCLWRILHPSMHVCRDSMANNSNVSLKRGESAETGAGPNHNAHLFQRKNNQVP